MQYIYQNMSTENANNTPMNGSPRHTPKPQSVTPPSSEIIVTAASNQSPEKRQQHAKSPNAAATRTSKKVATGHIKVPDICDVFDAEYRYVYTVPKDSMSHIPPNFFNVSASRLVLCRNGDNGECVKGPECKFIHVNRPLSTFQKQEIHINYAWRDLDAVLYPRTENACEEQTVSVLYPTTAGQIDATNDYTTTVGLREEHIPASHIIATEGSRGLSELSAPTAEPLLACLDFYLDRVCKCGPTCKRIHVAHLDAEAKAFQRAPAMRLVLLDAQKAIDEANAAAKKKDNTPPKEKLSKKGASKPGKKNASGSRSASFSPAPEGDSISAKPSPKGFVSRTFTVSPNPNPSPTNANANSNTSPNAKAHKDDSPLVPALMKGCHQLHRHRIAFTPPPANDSFNSLRMVRRSPNRFPTLPSAAVHATLAEPTSPLNMPHIITSPGSDNHPGSHHQDPCAVSTISEDISLFCPPSPNSQPSLLGLPQTTGEDVVVLLSKHAHNSSDSEESPEDSQNLDQGSVASPLGSGHTPQQARLVGLNDSTASMPSASSMSSSYVWNPYSRTEARNTPY